MFLIFGRLLLKMDFMYFVYFMCVEIMCTRGNMAEQPVDECFTLYKYIEKNKNKTHIGNHRQFTHRNIFLGKRVWSIN